jgi:hypothetical protein
VSGRQVVPGSAEMQEDGTQYRQRPWATRSAAARMLSTVPSCTVGVNPAARHISTAGLDLGQGHEISKLAVAPGDQFW